MHKSRIIGGLAIVSALAALTGCGLATASHGPSDPGTSVRAEPTKIDFVDPARVNGLASQTLHEGGNGARYVHISYPEITGADPLNAMVRAEVHRQRRAFEKDTSPYGPAPRPELNVDWQLPVATDEAVGVRLRTGEFLGANWGDSTRTYWYDGTTRRAYASDGLLSGQKALDTLAAEVRRLLAARDSGIAAGDVDPDPDLFDSMAFNRYGDLVVEFDECQVGACSLGRVAEAVPGAEIEPLLSETGRRVRRIAQESAPETTAPRIGPTHSPAATSNRAGTVDCETAKCVALTFDDGPGPDTGRLLDTLRDAGARATFFAVGANAAARPDLVRRMAKEGHLVGNHSWAHRDLSKLSSARITDSLARAQDTLTAAMGQRPTLARPPYGAVSADVAAAARKLGLALVTWDAEAQDRHERDPASVASTAMRQAQPGAIILLHDVNRATVDAVPAILDGLRGKGYTFVTVPELYSRSMQAGSTYRSGAK
ncbi:polysaccharide deacetylase family protein [Nonomuraea longicatena]|uniref:NodB homology domain-containing protein n=1 Tax=Nonomuraea longicatena TaxID=83682 RepID=A0ABP4BQZ9_9ACTN